MAVATTIFSARSSAPGRVRETRRSGPVVQDWPFPRMSCLVTFRTQTSCSINTVCLGATGRVDPAKRRRGRRDISWRGPDWAKRRMRVRPDPETDKRRRISRVVHGNQDDVETVLLRLKAMAKSYSYLERASVVFVTCCIAPTSDGCIVHGWRQSSVI